MASSVSLRICAWAACTRLMKSLRPTAAQASSSVSARLVQKRIAMVSTAASTS